MDCGEQVIVGALFQSKARAFIVDIEEGHRTATAMEDAGRWIEFEPHQELLYESLMCEGKIAHVKLPTATILHNLEPYAHAYKNVDRN